MSSNPQESAQEGSTNNLTAVISSSSSQENNENEMNSSIGSNRSLNNSRLFPFRINRDIILNNVSILSNVSSMSLKLVRKCDKSIHFAILSCS